MQKLMWFLLGLLISLTLLNACSSPGLEKKRTANPNFEVELLFDHEGCRVYRFMDSHYVYYVRCSGFLQGATYYTYNEGKVTHDFRVPTEGR